MFGKRNFDHIPDSVLLHIFSFLYRHELSTVGLVNRRWQRISSDGTLWRHIQLTENDDKRIRDIITTKCRSHLTRLNLTKCNLTPELMIILSGICIHLKELSLQKCYFLGRRRRFKLHVFKRLRTLDARLLRGNVAFVVPLLHCSPNLENLALDETIGTSWSGKILQKMNKLRLLDLTRCVQVNDGDLEIMAQNCRKLESLLLDKCFKIGGCKLPILLRECKMLKTLSLAFTRVSDEWLIQCDWANSSLTEVDFSCCYFLSTVGLGVLFANLVDCKYINLSNCTESSAISQRILTDVTRFQSLEVLNLDDGFETTPENERLICKVAQNCPKLTCFLVGITLQTASCLEQCLRSLPQLKRFGISRVDEFPYNWRPGAAANRLGGFSLEMILNYLASYNHKLEALQLSGYRDHECKSVTDGFVHLLRNCKNLSRICSFGGNANILIMAADAQVQTKRHEIRLIKPTMLFPTPRTITPPPSYCFDRIIYGKETSTVNDPWKGPFVYEVQRNRRFWIENAYE